jgi:hypothetical protein
MFFGAWLYRLVTMTWTVNATLTRAGRGELQSAYFKTSLGPIEIPASSLPLVLRSSSTVVARLIIRVAFGCVSLPLR